MNQTSPATPENSGIIFRTAVDEDLDAVIGLLADDPVSREREFYQLPLPASYREAFRAINLSSGAEVVVAERKGEIIGVLQICVTPHLTYGGSWRATIEGVRVAEGLRGQGIGTSMMRHAIAAAKRRGCNLIQLTTNAKRVDARRFYEALGFTPSHIGMKLRLIDDS